MSEQKVKCFGRKNDWPFCPWVLTGSMAKPYFFFEKKLTEKGETQVADAIGRELAKFMLLLDKLFITTPREEGELVIPGFEAWLGQTADKWSPDDCFCTEDMKMPPFKAGEKELLTSLWLKSRVLHSQ
jgi:hypothetical protein